MGKMYFGKPQQTKKYHIFSEGKSLCGAWAMPFFSPEEDDYLKGDEKHNSGDCIKCFKKLEKIKNENHG